MSAKSIAKGGRINADTMQKFLAFSSLVLLYIIFSVVTPNFFSLNNTIDIMRASAVQGVLALGGTFVIITGGIDLSLGTVMTFSSVIMGILVADMGVPVWLGLIACIVTGALCGLTNGFFIAKMKIPPFIATLGMMMITRGLSLATTGANNKYFTDYPGFRLIANGSVTDSIVKAINPSWSIPIPNAVLILFGMAILGHIILTKTVFGRYTFAMGSNEEATRLSGVNTAAWKMGVYTLCGAFTGVAGILMASRLNSAQVAQGAGMELDAFAAVVIGGTSMSGGEGTILGTIIGALLMNVLLNGLRISMIPQEWQWVATGAIVIFAVYMDIVRRRKRG
jgi:ribose transport system permease protein